MILAFATANEKETFEFVYTRWKKLMLSKAYGILHDYDLAQDAVSEAFIRLYKNLHKLDDLESGRTAAFLVMIVKNVSITMLNKRSRIPFEDLSAREDADSFDLENSVISKISAEALHKLIDSLNDDIKTPFLLKYAYGFSLKDISKMLKITENNAAVRIRRAKNKLAAMLKNERKADGL